MALHQPARLNLRIVRKLFWQNDFLKAAFDRLQGPAPVGQCLSGEECRYLLHQVFLWQRLILAVDPVGPPNGLAERGPKLFLYRAQGDKAVIGRLIDTVAGRAAVEVGIAACHGGILARGRGHGKGLPREHAFAHADVEKGALAAFLTAQKRRGDRQGRVHGTGIIGRRRVRDGGLAARAGGCQTAAPGHVVDVVARLLGKRAFLAIA